MSQLNTAPEVNPTDVVVKPTQILHVKPQKQLVDLAYHNLQKDIIDMKGIPLQQMNWVKLASKNKPIFNIGWLTTSVNLLDLNLDFAFATSLIPIGVRFNSFIKFSKFLISIKPTNNAFYQGLAVLVFDPAPTGTFYSDFYAIDISDPKIYWQFIGKALITPNNSDEINFEIPVNYPFLYFKTPAISADLNDTAHAQGAMSSSYRFGSLRINVLSPLSTTSPNTTLRFNISASIDDLETAGLKIISI